MRLLGAAVSLRESARVTGLNRKTIVRKFSFLAGRSRIEIDRMNRCRPQATEVEFDDLETFEHTKCKPLSVGAVIEARTRWIFGFEVAQMPANGRLARLSVKKYGPRADRRPQARDRLFERMQAFIQEDARIRTDSNPHYGPSIRKHFPKAIHETVLSRKSAITGQGELKKVGFDPIFSLNHTYAMFRAHLSRLIRKTWNTTKKPDRLADHLAIYALIHNQRLLAKAGTI